MWSVAWVSVSVVLKGWLQNFVFDESWNWSFFAQIVQIGPFLGLLFTGGGAVASLVPEAKRETLSSQGTPKEFGPKQRF